MRLAYLTWTVTNRPSVPTRAGLVKYRQPFDILSRTASEPSGPEGRVHAKLGFSGSRPRQLLTPSSSSATPTFESAAPHLARLLRKARQEVDHLVLQAVYQVQVELLGRFRRGVTQVLTDRHQ